MRVGEPDAIRYSYAVDIEGDSTAAKVLRLVGEGKRVLELGTAVGSMTRVLCERFGCTVVGVERDPAMAEQASVWCEKMVVGDLEEMNLADSIGGGFDVVVAADVLEHLVNPWRCLEQLPVLLNPEGYVVLSVPNVAHNSVIAALLGGRFPYRSKGLLDWTHLRFFTRADLEQMLLSTGLVPVVWDQYRISPVTADFDWLWLSLPSVLRSWLVNRDDGDVYQFIVKARPAEDAAVRLDWQQRLEAREVDYEHLKARLEEVEKDLAEHRKAFAEAREIIAARDRSLEECHKAFAEAREIIAARDRTLADQAAALGEFERRLAEAERLLEEHRQQARQRWRWWRWLGGGP